MNAISNLYYLEQIKQKNPVFISKIYHENKDKLFTFLLRKANGNRQIAEEVLSDTFESAIENAPKLKNSNNIQGWLFQIANRRLNDYFRKSYREKKYITSIDDSELYHDEKHIDENFNKTGSFPYKYCIRKI